MRWLLAYGAFSVPQAAGPIAFALLAIPLTGDPRSGAAIVLAITLAQVAGAVPVARLGRTRNPAAYLKALVAIRTLALVAVALLAAAGLPFPLLLAVAALAGVVNGAAFGYLRAILNDLVPADGIPRALGMASTLSEFTFVAAPVAASLLGAASPALGLLALSLLGAAPILLVPRLAAPHAHARPGAPPAAAAARLLTPPVLLWLACTLASSALVSSIEIGSVSLALDYGLRPAMGVAFTVALCAASVAGGLYVSVRNRVPPRAAVAAYLAVMAVAAAFIAAHLSVAATIAAAVLVGCVLSPLGTYCSLMLDALSPPHRKPELFALSRTANALGIILTSATLTLTTLRVTQSVATALVAAAALAVAATARPGPKRRT